MSPGRPGQLRPCRQAPASTCCSGLPKLLPPRKKSLMLKARGKQKLPGGAVCLEGTQSRCPVSSVRGVSEGSGNLRVLPGAYVSPFLGVRKHFKSEMLKKQCNKQLQTLHLDSPIVSILYALLMYINTHIYTHTHFCWLNHLKTTCRHCALEYFCINIFL